MSEQNPFAAIPREPLRSDEARPARPSERRRITLPPIRASAPAEEDRSAYGTAEVLADGLPAWNLEPPMAPVRRKRS